MLSDTLLVGTSYLGVKTLLRCVSEACLPTQYPTLELLRAAVGISAGRLPAMRALELVVEASEPSMTGLHLLADAATGSNQAESMSSFCSARSKSRLGRFQRTSATSLCISSEVEVGELRFAGACALLLAGASCPAGLETVLPEMAALGLVVETSEPSMVALGLLVDAAHSAGSNQAQGRAPPPFVWLANPRVP